MTTTTLTPYRSGRAPGRDGFAQLLRAEWTKFRTVRGWLIALGAAALLAVLATIGIAGAGRGGRDRPVRVRASVAGRRRQPHRRGDVPDRQVPGTAGRLSAGS